MIHIRILLTGFEPFGGADINPSWEVVSSLQESAFPNIEIVKSQLPVCFNKVKGRVIDLLQKESPDVLLSLGQSSDTTITLEKVAINFIDAQISDNCGLQPQDEYIEEDGPPAYFSTLPLRSIQTALHSAGIPAEISYSAGTFCCNQLMYCALHYVIQVQLDTKIGFIHVPCLPQQVILEPGIPSMALTTINKALTMIIQCLTNELKD
ncbi:MAG: pyroglutamyl-peptidase I [Candidatus Hodarchaeota archaeon]